MWTLRNYRFGFDPWGLGWFLLIMLPNFVWFTAPPANDILRAESVTPLLDGVGQVLQAVMAAALCAVVNRARGGPIKGWAVGGVLCMALYLAGWAAYYAGITRPAVILTLCLAPCGAFLSFALARKNGPALLAAAGFAICHLGSTVINFILCLNYKNPGAA